METGNRPLVRRILRGGVSGTDWYWGIHISGAGRGGRRGGGDVSGPDALFSTE